MATRRRKSDWGNNLGGEAEIPLLATSRGPNAIAARVVLMHA